MVRQYRDTGGCVHGVVCDLADHVGRVQAAREIAELTPTVDGLIHNAAIDPRMPLEKMSLDLFRHVMATNVEPAMEITRDLLPLLRASEAGRVLLIGSVTFDLGSSLMSAYVASKGAITGLTRSLAHELGSDGITVNCISPGAIVVEKEHKHNSGDLDQSIISYQSVKRRLVPSDLAGTVCLLMSKAGGAITGQTITVDGGLMHPIAAANLQSGWVEE